MSATRLPPRAELCRVIALMLFTTLFLLDAPGAPRSSSHSASSTERLFALPADLATRTLGEFSRQAEVQVLFPTDAIRGIRTQAVHGRLTPRAALERMVADTPLRVVYDEASDALGLRLQPDVFPAKETAWRKPAGFLSALVALFASPVTGNAQETVAPRTTENETVVLSPFLVSAENENGYLAAETLAGMRIKTNLKDTTAAIDVLTEKFLDDAGITNMNQALGYVANMSLHTFSATDTSNNTQWYSAPYMSRGVRGNTVRIDQFPAGAIPIDRYNTENLTFVRGPNSILFGIGSPTGQVTASAKRAQVNRDANSFRFITDNYGTLRGEVDVNKVLIKDTLALRFAALSEDRKSFQEPFINRRNSAFLTATYQPFKKTLITANAETGSFDRTFLVNSVIWDAYTPWVLAGKPTVNWMTGKGQLGIGKGNYDQNPGSGLSSVSGASYLVYIDGSTQPIMDWNNMARGQGWHQATPVGNPGSGQMIEADRSQLVAQSFTRETAPSFLDLDQNLFGGYTRNFYDYKRRNLFIQQNLIENLDAEFAYSRHYQDYDFDIFNPSNALQVDVNELLPNGQANPYVGMPYFESGQNQVRFVQSNENESLRFTLSYELDLDKHKIWRRLGWGRYRFAGMFENNDFDDRLLATRTQVNITPLPGTPTNQYLNQSQNSLVRRYYIKPGESNYYFDGRRLFDQATIPGTTTGPITIREVVAAGDSPRRTSQNLKGYVAAVQGYWWEAKEGYFHLQGMYGMRWDKRTEQTMTFNRAADGSFPLPLGRLDGIESAGSWNPRTTIKPETKTYGGIFRPIAPVRLFYNYSDIFLSTATAFTDVFNQSLRPTFGETKDYGIKLDLLKERLFFSATKFKTSLVDSRNDNASPIFDTYNQIYDAISRPDLIVTRPQSYRDEVTTGYEYAVTAAITKNWNARIAAGTQKTIITNAFNDFVVYFAQNRALWQQNAAVSLLNPTPGFATVADAIALADRRLADARSVNSQQPQDQRGRNFRFDTNYSFDSGRLAGFRVGAGLKYESRNVIGYARDQVGNLDVTKPFEGPALTTVDANIGYSRRIFGGKAVWDIQLNVYNLLDEDELIPRQAYDNGRGIPIATRRTALAPLSAQLSNSIRF